MEKFRKLGLSEEVLKVLKQLDFKEPTEIQEKAIALALAGKDIIGGSATGSGKTLVFASAIIENIKPNFGIQALILTPTRELAEQLAKALPKRVTDDLKWLDIGKKTGKVTIIGDVTQWEGFNDITKSLTYGKSAFSATLKTYRTLDKIMVAQQ